jgi:ketosteroid isomerase-like protein
VNAPAAALAALALGLAGCSVGDGDEPVRQGSAGKSSERLSPDSGSRTQPRRGEPDEAAAIREWSSALNREKYQKAASYFADDAIVEQTEELRLPDREAAVAFNRSLPCKADVTDVKDEGDTVLAAFRLRGGPVGGCDGGTARVRFRFRDGKFAEWRQLAEPPPAEGEIA